MQRKYPVFNGPLSLVKYMLPLVSAIVYFVRFVVGLALLGSEVVVANWNCNNVLYYSLQNYNVVKIHWCF